MSDRSRRSAGSRMEPESSSMRPQLSDEQWAMVSDLFKPPQPSPQGGRPRADSRACLEGVLWVLRSGARWKDLPRCFPSYPTCWRRFVEWTTDGTLDRAHHRLVRLLDESGQINWEEGFADGTFASAKKGAIALGQPAGARGPRSWSSPTAMESRWRPTSKRPTTPR
jgi:transposase